MINLFIWPRRPEGYMVLDFITIVIQNSISLIIDSREFNQRKRQLQRELNLKNLNSSNDLFASISTFQIIQSSAACPRMKLLLTALALREKTSCTEVRHKTSQNVTVVTKRNCVKFGLFTLSFCRKQQDVLTCKTHVQSVQSC